MEVVNQTPFCLHFEEIRPLEAGAWHEPAWALLSLCPEMHGMGPLHSSGNISNYQTQLGWFMIEGIFIWFCGFSSFTTARDLQEPFQFPQNFEFFPLFYSIFYEVNSQCILGTFQTRCANWESVIMTDVYNQAAMSGSMYYCVPPWRPGWNALLHYQDMVIPLG
jgi:hypothetical protein